jgi:hypothetical protein
VNGSQKYIEKIASQTANLQGNRMNVHHWHA